MKYIGLLISLVGWIIFGHYTPMLYYIIGGACLLAGWIINDEYKNK